MVVIIAIIAGCVVGFLLMSVIDEVQGAFNPILEANYVVNEDYYDVFGLAAAFVTNLWTYIIAFVIFVIAYWVYIYSQRSGAGY